VPTSSALVPAAAGRTRVVRTGEVAVSAPPDVAFPLFTPAGEKLWVAGWDPDFHLPAAGEAVAGGAFSTVGADGRTAHWVIVDWRPERHGVRYARITPGLRGGTVEVECRAAGAGGTVARVTYDLVAFSDEGDTDLAGWTEEWFRDYLAGWEREIAAFLLREAG
jgi:hypothetical protein